MRDDQVSDKLTRANALRYAQKVQDAMAAEKRQNDELLIELRGALLMNYALVKRLGGTVEVTAAELADATGQLRVTHQREEGRDVYVLTAIEPPPAEETTQAVTETPSNG